MNVRTAKICNSGGRESNQDDAGYVILEKEKMACWVVADGLGGHMGGETASKTAVKVVIETFKQDPGCSSQAITRYLKAAQQELLRLQQEEPRLSRMRTTIVIMVTDFEHFLWGHIGDSRFYHLEDGTIGFQTKDHSVPQSMVAAGDITPDQIRRHEDRNRLLRSLGQPESFKPLVQQEKKRLYDGDVFLLCTDGFWEYVEETEMEMDFAKAGSPQEWLKKMERRLLQRAEGEFDNYTAVAVYCSEPARPRPARPIHSPVPAPPPATEQEKPGKSPVAGIVIAVLFLAALSLAVIHKERITQFFTTWKNPVPVAKITSPADLTGSKRIYLPKNRKLYESLEEVWKVVDDNKEIYLGPGFFSKILPDQNRSSPLKGAGSDKTYLFIRNKEWKRKNYQENLEIKGIVTYVFDKPTIVEIYKWKGSVERLTIITIGDDMKTSGPVPLKTIKTKKTFQRELIQFLKPFEWIKLSFLKFANAEKK